MSKWSKRSPEEKVRILAEQEALRKKHDTPTNRFGESTQSEIIQRNEIPLVCIEHGFTSSERYKLVKEFNPLAQTEVMMVVGKCTKCGRISKRALNEAVMLLVALLKTQGRVER